MKNKKLRISILISLVSIFMLVMPMGIFADNPNFLSDEVTVKKIVKQNGAQAPGKEEFKFELFPLDGQKSPSEAGVFLDTNTIETNGANEFETNLKVSVDPDKIKEENGWKPNQRRTTFIIAYRIKEVKETKLGWQYGNDEYDLVVSYDPQNKTIWPRLYEVGNDTFGNTFINTFNGTMISDSFKIKKIVKQGGDIAPGKETFELDIIPLNNLAKQNDTGIKVTNNKVQTNGAGEFEGEFTFTLDGNKASEANGWTAFGKNKQNYLIAYRLQEKNNMKKGWEYSNEQYDLVISYYPEENSTFTRIYEVGTDASANVTFENTYKMMKEPVKPVVKENPKTGDTNSFIDLISLSIIGIAGLFMARNLRKDS